MTDQLVTFETAKLLKEKGFVNESTHYYGGINFNEGDAAREGFTQNNNELYVDDVCEAPTQSLAQRWLREAHKLIILIELEGGHDTFGYFIKNNHEQHRWVRTNDAYPTYELALESALQEALELINP
jgi:hypothetical protein